MYGHGGGNYCDPCSFSYGYGATMYPATPSTVGFGRGFAIILVLFILLLIIGAASFVV